MPKDVNILVAVNVVEAMKAENAGKLGKFVFMMDDGLEMGYSGDGNEGSNELTTTCENGAKIVWRVVSVQHDVPVTIAGFSGNILADPPLINPAQYPQSDSETWGGTVLRSTGGKKVQYSMFLSLDGSPAQGFDPYIIATDPQ